MQPPDPEALTRFWAFVAGRHNAYWRRSVLLMPPPWSADPILASWHFTNVYRELDPGTKYIVHRVLARPEAPWSERLFNIAAYRLAFHEDSMTALGWLDPLTLKAGEVAGQLAAMASPFTGAYMISNLRRKAPKTVVVADTLAGMAEALPAVEAKLRGAESRREAWEAMRRGWFGVGPFVAFQTLVDLSYPGISDGELPPGVGSNLGFAAAGAGSHRGLKRLWSGIKWEDCDEALAWLCDNQRPALWAMHGGWEAGTWSVSIDRANMQNCCCEFGKYERQRTGRKHLRRRFDAGNRHQLEAL